MNQLKCIETIGRFYDILTAEERQRVREAERWAMGRYFYWNGEGGRCLLGHALDLQGTDARSIEERLDERFGREGWQAELANKAESAAMELGDEMGSEEAGRVIQDIWEEREARARWVPLKQFLRRWVPRKECVKEWVPLEFEEGLREAERTRR